MTEISAAMVKQLRDATSAGMMDCKRALEETGRRLRRRSQAPAREGHGIRRQARRPRDHRGRRPDADRGADRRDRRRRLRDRAGVEERRLPRVRARGARRGVRARRGRRRRARGRARRARPPSSARTSRSSAPSASRPRTARCSRRVRPPAGEQGRRRRRGERLAGGRAPARDAHLVRPADVPVARRGSGRARRRRARDPAQAADECESKPADVREKIVEGMLNKRFYAESVLGEQTWIHDNGLNGRQGARAGRASSSSTTPGTRSADGGRCRSRARSRRLPSGASC